MTPVSEDSLAAIGQSLPQFLILVCFSLPIPCPNFKLRWSYLPRDPPRCVLYITYSVQSQECNTSWVGLNTHQEAIIHGLCWSLYHSCVSGTWEKCSHFSIHSIVWPHQQSLNLMEISKLPDTTSPSPFSQNGVRGCPSNKFPGISKMGL